MQQLAFPIKSNPTYTEFKNYLLSENVIQPSILFKSYVLAHAFDYDIRRLNNFILQIKETYGWRKLSNNPPRQAAYLSTILFNEIRNIEEALKADKIAI